MPHYVFQVRTPDRILHRPEGSDHPDLDAALARAQRLARALVRNPARRGCVRIGGSVDVETDGRAMARLLLSDVAHQITRA